MTAIAGASTARSCKAASAAATADFWQGQRGLRPFGRVVPVAQSRRELAQQVEGGGPAPGQVQREGGEQAPHRRAGVRDAAPGGTELADQRRTRARLVEAAVRAGRIGGNPFVRCQRIVGRARRRRRDGHEAQTAAREGRGGRKRPRLLADQPVEVEGAAEARRRRAHEADRRECQHQQRRRNPEEPPDLIADAVEIVQRHARRIGGQHLLVGQVVTVGEMPDDADLGVAQRHHAGADRAVVAGPERIGEGGQAAENHQQIEARVVVARRPTPAPVRRCPHRSVPLRQDC